MKYKKIIFMIMICLMVFFVSACSGETGNAGGDDENGTSSISRFKEDWYKEYCYYKDSNGDYFVLSYSDTILQINIADVGTFKVDLSKYKTENDNSKGDVYVYYDINSYELVKYYPESNNTIIIETANRTITCNNISEAEYLEAERKYANSQLEGFEEDWYKGKYLSNATFEWHKDFLIRNGYTFDGGGYWKINHKKMTNTSDIFVLEVAPVFSYMSDNVFVEFISDEYEIDYENYGYIYKSTRADGVIIYVEYFPKENTVKVFDSYETIGGAAVKTSYYYLVTEEQVQELYTININNTNEDEIPGVIGKYRAEYENVEIEITGGEEGEYYLTYKASGVTFENVRSKLIEEAGYVWILFNIGDFYPEYEGLVEIVYDEYATFKYSYNATIDKVEDTDGYFSTLERIE